MSKVIMAKQVQGYGGLVTHSKELGLAHLDRLAGKTASHQEDNILLSMAAYIA